MQHQKTSAFTAARNNAKQRGTLTGTVEFYGLTSGLRTALISSCAYFSRSR